LSRTGPLDLSPTRSQAGTQRCGRSPGGQHLAWIRSEALKQGTGEPTSLFPNEQGKPHDDSRVRKAFKRALKDAKLPTFRLYDLRHTYASLLVAERAPITYVAEQLGHANASTTLRYCARWIPSKGQRWADVLDWS
jgi:integrase